MTRDEALLYLHEYVGDALGGSASVEQCIGWCDENTKRSDLPREVDFAIAVLRGLVPVSSERPSLIHGNLRLNRRGVWSDQH